MEYMKSPIISIIIPVYKAEKFIHRCIDSVLIQSFKDYELILVDDGSPDNSGAICDEYAEKDARIKVLHKKNGGVSSARNAGIEFSSCEWIVFIDSDDYLQQDFLINPNDFKEDLAISSYEVFGDESNIVKNKNRIIQENDIKDFLKENLQEPMFRVPWAKYFRSHIIKDNNIRFQTDIHIGEDTYFMLDYLFYTRSIRFNASSMYMYKSDADYSRYALTPEKATAIFNRIYGIYKKLNIDSINFLTFVFLFYWGLISPDKSKRNANVWYNDNNIKTVYKQINDNISIGMKFRYYLYNLGFPAKIIELLLTNRHKL